MAYPYFPATYNPGYNVYPSYQQQMQQQMQMQQAQIGQQQIQYGNVVVVASEKEIDGYPVAPGNCVTFKIENTPYLITKTKPFSALEDPIYERYTVVKKQAEKQPENAANQPQIQQGIDLSAYALKTDLAAILDEMDAIKATVDAMKQKKPAKKEKDDE